MTERPGRLHPTRLRTLLGVAAVGLVVGWFAVPLMRRLSGTVPTVPWSSVLALLFAGAALAGMAWQTWYQLQRERRWMEPHRAVNFLVLAKASVLVGAGVAGVYAGYGLHYVDDFGYDAPTQRVLRAGVAALAGGLMVAGGLWLERACVAPGGDRSDDAGDDGEDQGDRDDAGGGRGARRTGS